MSALLRIKIKKLVETIVAVLLNRFDCFIVIDGNTGQGKSTIAYHIAKGVSLEFHRLKELNPETVEKYYEMVKYGRAETMEQFIAYLISLKEKDAHHFRLTSGLIYSQKEMIKKISQWNQILIPDEMINITFNRDFYSADQKNIVKIFNMYRDHNNLVLACVPRFNTLDNQIQNLVKMRLTVVRRGVALLQTPNKIIYGKDKWDSANNEKIERAWMIKEKSNANPKYNRLTTARGIITFKRLKPEIEAKYQKIKNDKRTVILHSEMGVEKEKVVDKYMDITERLIKGGIMSSHVLDGFAVAEGITPDALKNKIRQKLQTLGLNSSLTSYYTKPKKEEEPIKQAITSSFDKKMDKFMERFK